jgi:hypothetical protein
MVIERAIQSGMLMVSPVVSAVFIFSVKSASRSSNELTSAIALEELEMVAAEPDIAKVRIAIASVQSTLGELLAAAHETTGESSTIPTR